VFCEPCDLLRKLHVSLEVCRCVSTAGSVMYQYALRLAQDSSGLKGIQGQAKCLLAAMNALRLGDPKFAWVTRPVMSAVGANADDEDEDDALDEYASPPKRPCGLAVTESVSC